MTIEEMKTEYENNEEIKKFVDGIADHRVNQAQDTWNKKMPAEIEKRADEVVAERDRVAAFQTALEDRFNQDGINAPLGFALLGDVGADTAEAELETRYEEMKTRVNGLVDGLMKERFKGDPPKKAGDSPGMVSLENSTSEEILNNLDQFTKPQGHGLATR